VYSQLILVTNSCCESHTQAKRHSSQIMTEKDHLPNKEYFVICHSKMVHTTINQWERFLPTNHVYILYMVIDNVTAIQKWASTDCQWFLLLHSI
jgi:hypothetical protein